MPRWLQILLHLGVLGVGSYAAVSTGQPIPLVISSGVNAAIGVVAQSWNTDGTPQTVAFEQPTKKEYAK